MKRRYKCSVVTPRSYSAMVLCRLLRYLESVFANELNAVPMTERTERRFLEIHYVHLHRCMKACTNAGKKYPELGNESLRFLHIYSEKLREIFHDAAVNDCH